MPCGPPLRRSLRRRTWSHGSEDHRVVRRFGSPRQINLFHGFAHESPSRPRPADFAHPACAASRCAINAAEAARASPFSQSAASLRCSATAELREALPVGFSSYTRFSEQRSCSIRRNSVSFSQHNTAPHEMRRPRFRAPPPCPLPRTPSARNSHVAALMASRAHGRSQCDRLE